MLQCCGVTDEPAGQEGSAASRMSSRMPVWVRGYLASNNVLSYLRNSHVVSTTLRNLLEFDRSSWKFLANEASGHKNLAAVWLL